MFEKQKRRAKLPGFTIETLQALPGSRKFAVHAIKDGRGTRYVSNVQADSASEAVSLALPDLRRQTKLDPDPGVEGLRAIDREVSDLAEQQS